jgi:hypothetical protein
VLQLQVDRKLAVWDPVTGRRRELREPEVVYGYGLYAAAVLCAVSGCDHLACYQRPFRVVHFCLHRPDGADDFVAQARVSSLEMCSDAHPAQWSGPCPGVSIGGDGHILAMPPVLVDDALHFMLAHDGFGNVHFAEILKYDLTRNCLSLLDAPKAGVGMDAASMLMAMEDGSLGFAHLKRSTLFVWSRAVGSDDGTAAWAQRRVIDLKNLLPVQDPQKDDMRLLGSVEGGDAVFVSTDLGIYKIDLKSLRQKKISDGEYLVSLIPFMSFYNSRGTYIASFFFGNNSEVLMYIS